MSQFNKVYSQVLAFIRQLLHQENSNPPRQSRQNMFTGLGRLGLAPNGPRAGSNGNLGNYTEPSSQVKRHKYSVAEVKRILRGLEKGPLAYPVLYQASTFGALLDERMVRYFRGRERMFDRLPYVLLQYTQGKNCLDIAHSVSYFSDGDDVEDAIDFAALLISNQLNRQR
ncbi:MAG: hypothetical protein JWP00_4348 [Chloroflexi bacterium]|jgi:hypothetical protein|nr:hypothetical protein [Chloroflexota bacterium]